MKNYFTFALVCVFFLASCKNNIKTEVAKNNGDYKHSLAQWSLNKPIMDGTLDPMDFALVARELGFTGVEYVTQLYPSVLKTGGNYRERVMTLAGKLLEISKKAEVDNVLIMVDHAGELADPDQEKLKKAIKNHKIWMDAAKLMGAHSIRANLFGELNPEKWHALSVTSLYELGIYGKEIGVNILIENHGGWSSDGAKLAAVMKEVNMSTVGTLPDFGNFCVKRAGGARWGATCIEKYNVYKGTMELMPYAKGVSAKSYDFDEAGNETRLDYARLLQIVKGSGFKGYIGTEYEGSLEDPKEGIRLTKALIEKSLN